MNLAKAALLAGAVTLCCSGCAAIAPIGATIAGIKAAYDTAGEFTTGTSTALNAECVVWRSERGAGDARIASGIPSAEAVQRSSALRPFLDATCDPGAPAPADPAGAAIWLAGLVLRMHELTSAPDAREASPVVSVRLLVD